MMFRTFITRFTCVAFFVITCGCRTPSSVRAENASSVKQVTGCQGDVSATSCNYYDCLETKFQCGNKGYPLGYGKYYCTEFQGMCNNTLTSANAQKWVLGTTECLQETLANDEGVFRSCDDIKTLAFDSHPECYTNGAASHGGVSFCSLSIFEWRSIKRCVSLGDRLSLLGLKQISATAIRCGKFFAGGHFNLDDLDGDSKPDPETARMIKMMTPDERQKRAQEFFDFAKESL